MMIEKKNILAALAVMCITFTSVNAASLTQIDIKKTSDSAVDVTFYTAGGTTTPMVTRKSNNKYVVMMPNVAGQNAGTPNLGSVKDIISNVDVKNVDDGMNGYTKVTFITTKPINIKTYMKQSAPLSQEEKAAKALIAQVKTHPKQTVAPTEPTKTVVKTTVTSSQAAPSSSKKVEPVKKATTTDVKQFTEVKPKAVEKALSTAKPAQKATQTAKPRAKASSGLESPVQKLLDRIPDSNTSAPTVAPSFTEDSASFEGKDLDKLDKFAQAQAKKEAKAQKEKAKLEKAKAKAEAAKAKAEGNTSSSNKMGWLFLLLPLWLLYMMSKAVRNSVQRSVALKTSFKEHLEEKPYIGKDYENIISDSDINWQERYKKFVEESKNDVKDRNYTFISQAKVEQLQSDDNIPMKEFEGEQETASVPMNKSKAVNNNGNDTQTDISDIDKKRLQLESTLSKTPEIYKNKGIDVSNEPVSEVKTEDEAIVTDIHKLKLKAFAKPVSLHETNRNKVRDSIPATPAVKEGKHVTLSQTLLNKSARKFKDGALSVSDLINTGNKYLQDSSNNMEPQGYTMSSIEEYFNLLDKEAEHKAKHPDLSVKVAASLANVKPSMQLRKDAAKRKSSNPIVNRNNTSDYKNGLIVKSGYNIDENRGFYIVSLDGVSALVGRVKNEIFVLHKFNEEVDKLQVRLDSNNVYMVKAGNFRSMVDVDENKMGVLIEL